MPVPTIDPQASDAMSYIMRLFSGNGNNQVDPNKKISSVDPRLQEWIPPDRPLVGDKGQSHLYRRREPTEEEELSQLEEELKRLEEEEDVEEGGEQKRRVNDSNKPKVEPQKMDWLQTRREKLGSATVDGMTVSYKRPGQALPVLHHTLLTANEIMDYLASLGGMEPNLVEDQVHNQHGDSRMGGMIKGMIFVSANSCAHVRMLAKSLVEQLKLRKLQEVGVLGAHHGAEGSDDADETWLAIDCHNYVVHIQDEPTRRMLNLEEWWSQPLPSMGRNFTDDEDAMDEFVAQNPVPAEYGRSGLVNWNDTINHLENKRWTAPHKVVVERSRMKRKKNRRNKSRR